jgi:hypothetical protein
VLVRVSFIKSSNVCKSLSIEEKSCAKAACEESEENTQKQITVPVNRIEYFLKWLGFIQILAS